MITLDEPTQGATTTTSPLDAFTLARAEAEKAKATLLERLRAIKGEKKETLARLNAEAKEIRAALGRVRTPKAAKTSRRPKPTTSQKGVPMCPADRAGDRIRNRAVHRQGVERCAAAPERPLRNDCVH